MDYIYKHVIDEATASKIANSEKVFVKLTAKDISTGKVRYQVKDTFYPATLSLGGIIPYFAPMTGEGSSSFSAGLYLDYNNDHSETSFALVLYDWDIDDITIDIKVSLEEKSNVGVLTASDISEVYDEIKNGDYEYSLAFVGADERGVEPSPGPTPAR